jgi:amino-acid N-acetyltransferase
VRRIDGPAIDGQLQQGSLVLISPIGFSPTGEAFNLSYQDLASQVAVALGAEKLILMTEARGVVRDNNLVRALSLPELEGLRDAADSAEQQTLAAAYQACRNGVDRVHLVSCAEDGSLLTELFTRDGSGTLVMKDHSEVIRPATIEDVGGIIDLIAPLEEQQVLVKRSRELLETEIERFMLVVHPEGVLLGCAALYPTAADKVGELACVATHAEFHGQGIASRLFDAIVEDAQRKGLNQLFVLTTQAAHWFVERGFVEAQVADLPAHKQSLYNYQRNSRIFSKTI